MSESHSSSRARFTRFKKNLKEPITSETNPSDLEAGQKSLERSRTFKELLRQFFSIVGRNRRDIVWSLLFLTFGATIALIPPAATKIVFDNILGEQPLPADVLSTFPSLRNKMTLLGAIAIGTVTLALISLGFSVRGRWLATLVQQYPRRDPCRRLRLDGQEQHQPQQRE